MSPFFAATHSRTAGSASNSAGASSISSGTLVPSASSAGDFQTGPYPITQLPYDIPRPRRNLKPLWITLAVVLAVAMVGTGGVAYYLYRTEQRFEADRATVALPDKLADLVLWKPAFFGVKPELIIKGGFIAWSQMGDANA